MTIRELQDKLPWKIPYSEEFNQSNLVNSYRQIGHDLFHVMKSLGRIAADVELEDHGKIAKLNNEGLAREVADFVTCAIHIAKITGFDLQDAVISNIERRNGKIGE